MSPLVHWVNATCWMFPEIWRKLAQISLTPSLSCLRPTAVTDGDRALQISCKKSDSEPIMPLNHSHLLITFINRIMDFVIKAVTYQNSSKWSALWNITRCSKGVQTKTIMEGTVFMNWSELTVFSIWLMLSYKQWNYALKKTIGEKIMKTRSV